MTQTLNNSLAPLGAIRIAGPDRAEFLQGQLTQDIDAMQPGGTLLTGWASAKGRLLFTGWVLDWNNAYWLLIPEELIAATVSRLKMFALRAQVEIEMPASALYWAEVDSIKHPISDFFNLDFSENKAVAFSLTDKSRLALALTTGEGLASAPDDTEGWRLVCIRAGIPNIYTQTQEAFVPQMLNLDLLGGISFSKGCYVGQEIVARTQNLGRIKRRMYGFVHAGRAAANPGDAIWADGRNAGVIVDALTADDRTELLAVVRIEALQSRFSLDDAGVCALSRERLPYPVPESLDET